MSDYTGYVSDDDLAMYSDYGSSYDRPPQPSPLSRSKGKEEAYDDLADEEDDSHAVRFKKPTAKKQKQTKSDFSFDEPVRSVRLAQHQPESIVLKKFESHDVDPSTLLEGYTASANAAPIQLRPRDQIVIPYRIYNAAIEIMEAYASKEIRIRHDTQTDMEAILTCDDEFTKTDPYVVLCDTLSTGSCKIYMKEVVPTSILLLAQALTCTYQVEIMPGKRSNPKLYTLVTVKPFHDSITDYAQPFGCEEAVREQLGDQADDIIKQVQVFMLKLGVIPSREACLAHFLAETGLAVKKLLEGSLDTIQRGRKGLPQ